MDGGGDQKGPLNYKARGNEDNGSVIECKMTPSKCKTDRQQKEMLTVVVAADSDDCESRLVFPGGEVFQRDPNKFSAHPIRCCGPTYRRPVASVPLAASGEREGPHVEEDCKLPAVYRCSYKQSETGTPSPTQDILRCIDISTKKKE